MAQTLKIKRSSSTVAPSSLAAGELAYSSKTGTQKLYIGDGSNVLAIGGKSYTDKLDGIEAGATADQTAGEIETAYNNQVTKVNATEITNGTEVGVRRYSPADIVSLIDTHAAGAYTLPLSTNSVRGGVKVGYTTNNKNYAVQLNNEQMYVNVPWTDTVYTLPEATATAKGGIELFSNTDQSVAANAVSSTASRTYGLQLNSSGQGVVNVPWVNTEYSVGDGGLSENNFTNTLKTKLGTITSGATPTSTTNVQAAGALMDTECTSLASVKAINQGLTTTSNPTFGSGGTAKNLRVNANGVGIGVDASSDYKLRVNGSMNASTVTATRVESQGGLIVSSGTSPSVVWRDDSTGQPDVAMKNDNGVLTASYHTNYLNEESGVGNDIAVEVWKSNQYGISIGAPIAGTGQGVIQNNPSSGVRLHVNGGANVEGNLTVEGNFSVTGTTTTVNTEEIKLADNNIVLNSNLAANANASEDAGITINRGAYTDVQLLWDETNHEWKIQTAGDSSASPTTTPILSADNFTTKITTIDGGTF